jgi:hypothetical protein
MMTLMYHRDFLVDLRRHFGHTSSKRRGTVFEIWLPTEFIEERQEMDTNSFDKQAKQHLKVYENVMFAAKICIVAIIATLALMAATLV